MRIQPILAALLAAALVLAGASAAVQPIDWTKFTDTETVQVLSADEDGGLRLTTVWIVVVDRNAYLRTAGTTWGDNVERNGSLKLRLPNGDKPLRAEKVLSANEVERVVAAFREKYGTTDAVMELVRFGERRVFRLVE